MLKCVRGVTAVFFQLPRVQTPTGKRSFAVYGLAVCVRDDDNDNDDNDDVSPTLRDNRLSNAQTEIKDISFRTVSVINTTQRRSGVFYVFGAVYWPQTWVVC